MRVYVCLTYGEDLRTGQVTDINVIHACKTFAAAKEFIYRRIETILAHGWRIVRDSISRPDMLDRFAFEYSVSIEYGNTRGTFVIGGLEIE